MIRTRKSNRRKKMLASQMGAGPHHGQSAFLATGRKMNWFTVGASIFASNLGSEHFIGLSGSAAANGISVAAFEMNALLILQLATWVFLPVLIVSKISTLPEYMSKRFGGKRIRTYLAVLSILLYIFTKISVNLYSGGIFLQQAIGWGLYSSAMFILALTCIMTLTGGLKGAMVIDNLQAIVMTVGASIVATKALVEIGGIQGLKQRYSVAVPTKVPANLTHCAKPNPRAFQMLRPYDDPNMPWLGFIIGQTPASIWYWAADQMMVQRFLSARSLAHVQGASVFAGYLKILPLVLMVIPGMISRCLYTDEVGCIDSLECQRYCQSTVSCSNTAYPRLVLELMPMGARGMMVAAMVAALMADLCNVFNSASALFSCDIWPLFRKHATPKEQATVGRIFVICLVMASIMWIPVIQEMQGGQLFIYIQAVAALFAPPIAGVYICAVLWRRTNETGAFWSLMVGFGLGFYRMALSFMHKEPSCGQQIDSRPWILKLHFMYYAAFLFWITISCCTLISRYTKPPAAFRLIRTTYWTRFDTNVRKDDKNVFEMKYSAATLNSSSSSSRRDDASSQRSVLSKATEPDTSSDPFAAGKSSQQRLFTIEEQQEKKTADLSSVIVDISKESDHMQPTTTGTSKVTPLASDPKNSSAPAQKVPLSKRQGLQHQASLSASAAVEAASEAGKFLANKLAQEVNLKGARDLVKHFTEGATSGQRIKFQNLKGDEDEEEEDDDDEEIEPNVAESSPMDDDDEDDDSDRLPRRQRFVKQSSTSSTSGQQKGRLARRGQSVISAALNSYKQKQKGGYRKAANEEDNFEEDEEEDEDEDERFNLSRSALFKGKSAVSEARKAAAQAAAQDLSSSTDDRLTPTTLTSESRSGRFLSKGSDSTANSTSALDAGSTTSLLAKKSSSSRRSAGQPSKQSRRAKVAGQVRSAAGSIRAKLEGDLDEDLDQESGRTYKCLDNSVALLIKTRFEETLLRIALVAIIFVAFGLFILLSLPPPSPPADVLDILIKE